MKCQSCSKPATVHLTDISNGVKKELHLCQGCAEKQHLLQQQGQLNLKAILQALIGQHVGEADELARLTCPQCGIKYMEFRAEGRLGCPNDYEVFRTGLGPLLKRIHRATRHIGKTPRHGQRNAELLRELMELRRRLQRAVDAEAYEEAARLRDEIRKKEAVDES
ncbi:MAG: UvrB/UvrC protein [Gemmatales bacterium]|nr:MAG: UvrB/UvrC protein [Gemmatales bacterium]